MDSVQPSGKRSHITRIKMVSKKEAIELMEDARQWGFTAKCASYKVTYGSNWVFDDNPNTKSWKYDKDLDEVQIGKNENRRELFSKLASQD